MGFIKDALRSWGEGMESMFSKGFVIELEDRYSLPSDKNFTYPGAETVCAAIEKYGESNKEHIDFVSRDQPVIFWINHKEQYKAEIRMSMYGRGGYYCIHCLKL